MSSDKETDEKSVAKTMRHEMGPDYVELKLYNDGSSHLERSVSGAHTQDKISCSYKADRIGESFLDFGTACNNLFIDKNIKKEDLKYGTIDMNRCNNKWEIVKKIYFDDYNDATIYYHKCKSRDTEESEYLCHD